MPFYEKGDVRIHYQEAGSGFPLLVIPGGGLNSTVAGLATHPFNPFDEFNGEFRVIAADLRNAKGGESTGPLETDRPWDAYTDDHIGLMAHLGIRQFMVLGFCIGGPFIWNLLQRAGDRVVAAVPAQPSGEALAPAGGMLRPHGHAAASRAVNILRLELVLRAVDVPEPLQRIRTQGETEALSVGRMHHPVRTDVEWLVEELPHHRHVALAHLENVGQFGAAIAT
jgi:pimeloyl-ACP methyl ester carboxylesterase